MSDSANPLCVGRDGFAVVDTDPDRADATLGVGAVAVHTTRDRFETILNSDLSRDGVMILSLSDARDRAREAGWDVPAEEDITPAGAP
jgi:hypothetical protein